MDDLWRKFSHSEHLLIPGHALKASIQSDAAEFPDVSAGSSSEPYRFKCRYISANLRRTLDYLQTLTPRWDDDSKPPAGVYLGREGLLDDLRLIADDLFQAGAWVTAHGMRAHDPTFCVHDHSWKPVPFCCDFIFASGGLPVRSIAVDLEAR